MNFFTTTYGLKSWRYTAAKIWNETNKYSYHMQKQVLVIIEY